MRWRVNWVAAASAILSICVFGHRALADGPRLEIPNQWAGLYIGGYAGRAWGDSGLRTEIGEVVVGPPEWSYFQSTSNIDAIEQAGSGSAAAVAFIGGAQIGANVQRGMLVAGLEADFGSFNLTGARGTVNAPYPFSPFRPSNYTVRASMDTDWLLTARARLGWAVQRDLIVYATAGLALTNLRVSNSFSDDADSDGTGGGSHSRTVAGWTVGAGAELALAGKWSVKAEYLYVDFGSTTAQSSIACGPNATFNCQTVPVVPIGFSTSADLTAHTARVGLNYRF